MVLGSESNERPEGAAPEGTQPEDVTPEDAAPEDAAPEGAAPEGTQPEGTQPEGAAPEGATPEGTQPEGKMAADRRCVRVLISMLSDEDAARYFRDGARAAVVIDDAAIQALTEAMLRGP